ncbi:hypothetical protein NM688_g1060 [Phlebia brevispora]|uniref:Uncharacterized protein n=1 Tax=Phlebia brevispora TaxID=194682 RepID=A0ACC1TCL2_9APHY|nr:hypothetical protein NM688_g1060 [Phlebia brevispora]
MSLPELPEKHALGQGTVPFAELPDDSTEKGGDTQKYILDLEDDADLPTPQTLTEEEEKRLYRKIDWRLMPMLTLMYLCSFLDRDPRLHLGNIGNAKLQGLTTQLHLTGNKYNVALAMYFIVSQYMNAIIDALISRPALLSCRMSRQSGDEEISPFEMATGDHGMSLPQNIAPALNGLDFKIAWGVIMSLMGIVKTYPQLVGVRVALGAAEAGLFPGVAWYLSMWYPRHMLQFRIGMFWGGATIAGAFSGILAYGISFMSGTSGRLGWSWIFIIEGSFTVAVGLVSIFVLIDSPSTAKFLTPQERVYILWRKKYDNSLVGEEEAFAFRHVWAAISDWQTWMHVLIYMSIIGPLYGISFFLPSIINGFGFSPANSQLLTVPPYVFATIVTITLAVLSDYVQKRAPFVFAGHLMCLIGFSIQISDASFGVKYFGTFFCVAGSYAAFPGVITWLANNVAGQYKRGAAIALHIGFGNFAGSIASVLYRSQDAPRYILGAWYSMNAPTTEEVRAIARKAISIFDRCGFSCCLVGGAACGLYGVDRTPNDVDLVVQANAHGQEYLKQLLCIHDSATFYLRSSKNPAATYRVLFAYLSPSTSRYSRYRRSCKVDVLQPGIMNIPSVSKQRIVHINALPVMPFIPLLMLKLQAWEDHSRSWRADFQSKKYVDVRDIEKLLKIAVERKENVRKDAAWLPESFVKAGRERLSRFLEAGHRETKSAWRRIGFDVDTL